MRRRHLIFDLWPPQPLDEQYSTAIFGDAYTKYKRFPKIDYVGKDNGNRVGFQMFKEQNNIHRLAKLAKWTRSSNFVQCPVVTSLAGRFFFTGPAIA